MNILKQIVESKKLEIEALYIRYDLRELQASAVLKPSEVYPQFYQRLAEARKAGEPFFIAEFKRKSPSEGWINQNADLPGQIQFYTQAGASAISILTDEPFFGGNYDDLKQARSIINAQQSTVNAQQSIVNAQQSTVNAQQSTVNTQQSIVKAQQSIVNTPLLLQKDFILDPIQIYLAKRLGADLILLIAAILEPEQLDALRKTAESIGLGVLVEVHDAEELKKIQHLDFQVLGINNRDLKTFRTSLNRVNVLALTLRKETRFVIAESGVLDYRHFQMVQHADGFLIGTGLMRESKDDLVFRLTDYFQSQGRLLFKACGSRQTTEHLHSPNPTGFK